MMRTLEGSDFVRQLMYARGRMQGPDDGAKALAIPGSNPANIELWKISEQV